MFLKRWKNNYKGTDKLVQDNDSYEGNFFSLLPFAWFFHSGRTDCRREPPVCVCDVVPWAPVRITTALFVTTERRLHLASPVNPLV